MATRRPLVLISGRKQELPVGDTVAGATSVFSVSGTLDFGLSDNGDCNVSIAATWAGTVPFTHQLNVNPSDHDIEDIIIEGISVSVYEDSGVGFNVYAHAPYGSWGRYTVTILGWS